MTCALLFSPSAAEFLPETVLFHPQIHSGCSQPLPSGVFIPLLLPLSFWQQHQPRGRAGASVWPCGGARSQGCETAVLELLLTPTKLLLLSSLILPLDRAARAAKKEVSGSTLVKTAQWKARRGKRAGDECPSNLMALKPHSISSLPPLPTKLAPKRMGVLSKQAPELRRCESNKNKGSSQAMTAEINTVPISGEMVLI